MTPEVHVKSLELWMLPQGTKCMIKLRILTGSAYPGFLSRLALHVIMSIFIRERQS